MVERKIDKHEETKPTKPLTIIKQILNLLESPEGKSRVYLKPPLSLSFDGDVTLYISPVVPTLDEELLRSFGKNILELLEKNGLEPDGDTVSLTRNPLKRKDGLEFPEISFDTEIIGKKVTSTYIAVSDSFYPDKINPLSENITRRGTTIKICPSPQIVELAFAAATFNLESIDKGFKATNALRDGITKEQLKLVRKTTVRCPVRPPS